MISRTYHISYVSYPEDKQLDALCRIPIGDKELPQSSPCLIRATARSMD